VEEHSTRAKRPDARVSAHLRNQTCGRVGIVT
jgi:hypothetical protein